MSRETAAFVASSATDFSIAEWARHHAASLLVGCALAVALQLGNVQDVRYDRPEQANISITTPDVASSASQTTTIQQPSQVFAANPTTPSSTASSFRPPLTPSVTTASVSRSSAPSSSSYSSSSSSSSTSSPPFSFSSSSTSSSAPSSHVSPPATGPAELYSMDEWEQATVESSRSGRVLATILTSPAASKAHGAAMDGLVRHFSTAGVDFAVVVVAAEDVASNAEGAKAALVRRLKCDGLLVLPSLTVTGGKGCDRYMKAAGLPQFRQTLADAAHRNAHGVKSAAVPMMA
ncbi:hypothetical protein GPECTOR_69g427 [Gonium pectorale]|uniref:Uncharacterized protein n=1 Tax=Gonium pectorale TaxID=33097 RepID=A0A150G3D7_GONPE|nr:hypothetical protein GPECTOR_69g427 [Gonium pectorale]|eukprot:KXZ44334.1 hypothetical protein GPECTOR_69g427 [Gonium pectorale]